MKKMIKFLSVLCCLFIASCQVEVKVDEDAIRKQILDNGQTIRNAFAKGDIDQIKSLHHPDVKKALGYTDLKNGREEVIEGIKGTLENFSLEFTENIVESLLIQQDLVIEQSRFSIKGSPKDGGEGFIFKGRTMVTYVRYEESPTGWATIREIIQPAIE